MATLTSNLIMRLKDRVTGPGRAVSHTMRKLRRETSALNTSNIAMAKGAGRTVARLAVMGGAYLGVGAGLGGATNGAMKMEDALVNLEKVSDLDSTELAMMRDRAVELSGAMPLAAGEILNLMAAASQFGIAKHDLEEFALLASKAAVAFEMDPSQTSKNLSELKNAYGLSIEQLGILGDAINKTADTAGTSESSLIDFMLRTGATAKTFGVSAQDMAAFGATLNEIGIGSAKAATGVNAMMNKMPALTKKGSVVKVLDAVGGKGYAANLQKKFFETPVEAMNELFKTSQKMTKSQRAGFFLEFFGLEYGDDAAAITENIDKIIDRQQGLRDSSRYVGSVQQTYDKFASTTSSKLKILGNNIRNVGNALGVRLLPGIAAFSDRLSKTLGTLDERITVFDRVGVRIKSFLNGMGADGDKLKEIFDSVWRTIFGDPEAMEADTALLVKAAHAWNETGEAFGSAFGAIASTATAIEQFIGADPGTAASLLGDLAKGGVYLGAAALGITATGRAIGFLARMLFKLTGASLLLGGTKGIRNMFRALAGAGAVAAALGTSAAFKSKRGKGKPPVKPSRGPVNGMPGATKRRLNLSEPKAKPGKIGKISKVLGPAALAFEGYQIVKNAPKTWSSEPDRDPRQKPSMRTQRFTPEFLQDKGFREPSEQFLDRKDRPKKKVEIEVNSDDLKDATASAAKVKEGMEEINATLVEPRVSLQALDRAHAKVLGISRTLDTINKSGGGSGRTSGAKLQGARARGGRVWPGSWLVGEQGPEIVELGQRGYVHTAAKTAKMLSGNALRGRGSISSSIPGIDLAGMVAAISSLASGSGGSPMPTPSHSKGPPPPVNISVYAAPSQSPRELATEIGREVSNALGSHHSDFF